MRARKQLGQHFLEPAWADKLVAAIEPRAGDRFLEIGPGPGALTFRLARRVAEITAVEIDHEMVARLRAAAPPNVEIVHGDFLDVDVESLTADSSVRVAGNLPYNVASPILFKLLRSYREHRRLIDATVMVQREVAVRIRASPGTRDYGILSVLIQLHADVRLLMTLPPGAFRPQPRVHSSIISLTFRPPAVFVEDEETFEQMVRSMFTQRRKMLANALQPFASAHGLNAADALARTAIDPTRRPETLQLEELARLAAVFSL